MLQAPSKKLPKLKPATSSLVSSPSKHHWSFVLLALVAFFFFDALTRVCYQHAAFDHFASPNRSAIWWTVKDFRQQKQTPDLIFMGSSLMMAALHGSDATYLQKPQNLVFHHHSQFCEDLLIEKGNYHVKTFAFAIGGQMASDAYAICSGLLTGQSKPKYIIYGIAPRDFMDNTLKSPASTETFRYLSKISDLRKIAIAARPSLWDRLDYYLGKISFLYGHRLDYLYLANHYEKALLSHFTAFKDLESIRAPFALRKIAMFELPEDFGPNELFTRPYNVADPFLDNSAEYKQRYAQFDKHLFEQQIHYLEETMKICHNSGIALILVNMPLTEKNMALMPPNFYKDYYTTVNNMCDQNKFELIDLNKPSFFKKQYFSDTAHLNGLGGKLFFQTLASELLNNPSFKSTFRLSSQ